MTRSALNVARGELFMEKSNAILAISVSRRVSHGTVNNIFRLALNNIYFEIYEHGSVFLYIFFLIPK
jgi:hypothetical protein